MTTIDSNAFNVFMYNNTFFGTFGHQHMGGIEFSMHGTRIATNGDIHLLFTPEQWDATPAPSSVSEPLLDENGDPILNWWGQPQMKAVKKFDEETNTIRSL